MFGCLVAVVVIAGCGEAAPGRGPVTTVHASNVVAAVAPTAGTNVGGTNGTGVVHEVADPEESRSFPVPAASVHHQSASAPAVAGEVAVAAGAPSDAEVRKELGEEEQAKAQERAAQQRVLTPVAGGSSVGGNGTIPIPTDVPEVVQRVIAGGNAIADYPYIWGGGHDPSFISNGYDCSGSVSYALAAGGLLGAPLVSGELASWGDTRPGPLDHDLRQRRPHVHGRRRHLVRHCRALRTVCVSVAARDAAARRLRGAASTRVLGVIDPDDSGGVLGAGDR